MKQGRESYCSGLLEAGNCFSASCISGECHTIRLLSTSCVIKLVIITTLFQKKKNQTILNMYPFIRTFTWNIANLCSCFMSYMFYIGSLLSCASGQWDIGQTLDLCSLCLIIKNSEILFLTPWSFPEAIPLKLLNFYKKLGFKHLTFPMKIHAVKNSWSVLLQLFFSLQFP